MRTVSTDEKVECYLDFGCSVKVDCGFIWMRMIWLVLIFGYAALKPGLARVEVGSSEFVVEE